MNNMTEIWNRRLMGTERDVSVQAIPSIRYAILSVPRSGSTLVARGLEATSELGVPLEYFNPNAIEAWRYLGRYDSVHLEEYLDDIERRRTANSGYFGIKVHYRHFEHHFGAEAFERAISFVERQDYCILTTRKDQISQVVSYFRARRSGLWSSEHEDLLEGHSVPPINSDATAILECLDEVVCGESMWRQVLEVTQKQYLEISYEDLTHDYDGQMKSIFGYLHRPELPVPAPQIRRLSGRADDDLNSQFRQVLHDLASGSL